MRFGIFSDLHMEFTSWEFTPEPDVFYLNAGDTHPDWQARDRFHSKFKGKVFSVKGNHDYYGGSFKDADSDFPVSVYVGDGPHLKIAGATLWTDIHEDRWWDFKRYMVDAKQIRGMGYDQYNNAHHTHKKYLFNSDADIWVIHHLPSYQSVHERYRHSDGNDFFATELSTELLTMWKPPKLIVHGHTHERFDYMIGATRVICNPRGYPNENPWFREYKPVYVEIDL